jgi:TonB-linked SusC/RagA family outer membrane protein
MKKKQMGRICNSDPLKKILRIMKLSVFLFFLSFVQAFASHSYAQKTKLSVDSKNASIESVLLDIENQSDYKFIYNKKKVDVDSRVNIQLQEKTIKETLNALFEGRNVNYAFFGNNIVLTNPEADTVEMQQQKSISGKVTDSSGTPIPGVTVLVKGTTTGTITDGNGNFSLANVSENATLQFSFVGMKTQEIPMTGKTSINVTMAEETVGIEEVVAIGYGTKLKGELTGSISKVNSDKIESRPVTGTMEALQGLVPGVTITRQNGKPGRQDYELKIRGASSINGNVPLVLVDGIPGDISLINPNDIESLTVLKDAAAAIYGARAADGVILVTTKRGKKSDTPLISYSYNLAFKRPSILKKTTTTAHFVEMFNEANANDGDPQTFSDATLAKVAANDPGVGPGENWGVTSYPMFYQSHDRYGDIFETAQRQTHNLSISGGTDYSTYLISAGYLNDNGNISTGKNSSDRYNLRMSLQTKLRKNINLDANISYDSRNITEPSMFRLS